MSRRQHICHKDHRAIAAGYFYRLDIRVMPRNVHNGNPGNNLHIAIDEPPLPCFGNRNKSVREIACAVALRRIHSVFEFRALHDILRVRKSRHIASVHNVSISACVIKVQVRVDNHIDFLGSDTKLRERIPQRVAFLNAINISQLGVPLGAITGFYKNIFTRGSYKQRVGRQSNAIAVVRGGFLFPERLPHDTEHRAAIEIKVSAVQGQNFNFAEMHQAWPRTPRPLLARISLTAVNGSLRRSATSYANSSSFASPAAPPTARSNNLDSRSSRSRFFQCSTCFFCRSGRDAKCWRNLATVSASESTPRFSDATVRITGGCQPCCGITSESMAFNCCSTRSAPSRSLLFTTKISAISIKPAFMF